MTQSTKGLSGGGVARSKNFRSSWKNLFLYMGKMRKWFAIAIVIACLSSVLSLIAPTLMSDLVDKIIEFSLLGDFDLSVIAAMSLVIIAVFAGGCILGITQGWIIATVTQRLTSRLRSDISAKIDRLPISRIDSMSAGDIMSRMTNDTDTFGQELNRSLSTLITALLMAIGSTIALFVTNAILAIIAISVTCIGFLIMVFIVKKSQRYFREQQNRIGDMNGHVTEVYSHYEVVRTHNGLKKSRSKFDRINENLRKSGFRSASMSGLIVPLMTFVNNFNYLAVCVVGSILTINYEMTFGNIISSIIYVRLFSQTFQQVSQAVMSMQLVAACSDRIFDFLSLDEMEAEADTGDIAVRGEVEFRDVRFGYTENKEVLKGISFKVSPGQKVAIVGQSGCGKTTLINLLMKFYDVGSGDILFDGVSIRDISREHVHEMFSMVLQDTWIFNGTIRENVVYQKTGVTDEQLDDVMEKTSLSYFISTLPNGYDTVLDESVSLSLGQRQQLTIARAMINSRSMIILDEATSSVDTRTEAVIQKAMDSLSEGKTSFVIAHRLSTIMNADVIMVMKDGVIAESGNHSELIKMDGTYRKLYGSQFRT